jgi:hypothetical protein
MLGATGQNLVATVTWPPEFEHHWLPVHLLDNMFNCWNAFVNKTGLELVTYAPVCGVSGSLISVLCRRGKRYFCIIFLFRNIVLIVCSLYFITYRAGR